MRRSAFIPKEGDGKQCITKDESEMLRDSIISLTRPRISRPWFDRPPSPVDATTLIAKKNTSGGSARSNSSSGCSSDPQSGPSSPISSKCSSEGGSNARCRQSQQQQNGIIGQRQKEAAETAGLEVNRQPQMPSSSLILKVISSGQPTTATVNNNSGDHRTTAQIQQQQQQQPLLKRKDFPSYQRRRVCMPTPPTQHCQPKPTSICLPPSKVVGSTADEVEELSRAARKQMAILEELEVENQERKTRITGHQLMATINSPTGSTSIRPLFHASSSTTSSPPSQRQPSFCSPSTSGSLKAGQSKPQMELARLLVEGQTRRRQSAAANEDQDRPKAYGGVEQQQQQHQEVAAGLPHQLECKACGTMITDVILQALGSSFHPACFRCNKCGKCLDGVPFAVDRAGAVICMEDYERHFVPRCQRCQKPISAVNEFGEVVRVVIQEREYHIQCYCCEGCGMQLSNEQQSRCYPLGDHLLCRRCHTLWRRMGALDSEAAVSDL